MVCGVTMLHAREHCEHASPRGVCCYIVTPFHAREAWFLASVVCRALEELVHHPTDCYRLEKVGRRVTVHLGLYGAHFGDAMCRPVGCRIPTALALALHGNSGIDHVRAVADLAAPFRAHRGPDMSRACEAGMDIVPGTWGSTTLPVPPKFRGLSANQVEGLRFMVQREQTPGFATDLWALIATSNGHLAWHSPVFRAFRDVLPSMPTGGILADRAGMGKRVTAMALVAATSSPEQAPTLVLCRGECTVSWAAELGTWFGRSATHRVVCRGTTLSKLFDDPLTPSWRKYDVLVVPYGLLDTKPLNSVTFHRVIFDDAHAIPNPNACAAIRASRRWALTSTPEVGLQGTFKALRYYPLCDDAFFAEAVTGPNGTHEFVAAALATCMVRRKITLDTVVPLCVETRAVELTPMERRAYNEVGMRSKALMEFRQAFYTRNDHVSLASLVLPLRRLAVGGTFVMENLYSPMEHWMCESGCAHNWFVVDETLKPATNTCALCWDAIDRVAVMACGHMFCAECLATALHTAPACPMCRTPAPAFSVRVSSIADLPGSGDSAAARHAWDDDGSVRRVRSALLGMNTAHHSKMLEARRLITEWVRAGDCVLVFSKFPAALGCLQGLLREQHEQLGRVTGWLRSTMSLADHVRQMDEFRKGVTRVLLMPMTSVYRGTKLAIANRVLFLDPTWEEEHEAWAIGLAHTLGQRRVLRVTRLVARDTIEEAVLTRRHAHNKRDVYADVLKSF